MAWWRGLLKVIFSILLVVSLILLVATFSMSKTVTHDNLRPVFADAIKPSIETNDTNLALAQSNLAKKCTNKGIETVELPLGEAETGLGNITLKCADIKASTSQEMENIFVNTVFDQKIYYKKYDCAFIDCLRDPPADVKGQEFMILFSDMASQSFRMYTNYLSIIALVLIILLILLSTPKYTLFLTLGADFIIAGLPFFAVNFGAAKIPMPEFGAALFKGAFNLLAQYFLIALILGIALLIVGIIIRANARKKMRKEKNKKENKEE
jgi:hypothetical protein